MGNDSDVDGPIFVSIGDEEKLSTFLENNPYVSPEQILVDGYDFDAYKSAGFGRFDEQDKEVAKEVAKNLGKPNMGGFAGWKNYLFNVMKVSPVPKDMKFGDIPEGVLRLGGTFVISGNEIVYRWSDRLPGDHPDIKEVLAIAKEASTKKNGLFSSLESLLPSITL